MKKTKVSAQPNPDNDGDKEHQEKEIIKKLGTILNRRINSAYDAGKLINELITLNGGIRYGDETINSLTDEPNIPDDSKTLRRYWHFYLLYKDYGDELKHVAPTLTRSFAYQIARFLDVSLETATGKKAEAIKKEQILKYAEWKHQKTVAKMSLLEKEFGKAITKAIKALERDHRITPAPSKKSKNGKGKNKPGSKTRETPQSIMSDILRFGNRGLEYVADYVQNISDPEYLKKANINARHLCQQSNKLANSLIDLVEHIIEAGEADGLDPALPNKLRQLADRLERQDVRIIDQDQQKSA